MEVKNKIVGAIKDRVVPKPVWGLIALGVVVAVYLVYRFAIAKPGEEAKSEPMIAQPSEEEKQLWYMEKLASEKLHMRESADRLKGVIANLQGMLQNNQKEAESNQATFKQMFASHKSSYDDDMVGMEDEQNIGTAFMLKEDLEGKKKGMIQLGKELSEQRDYLIKDMNGNMEMLQRLNHEWTQQYPAEAPLLHSSQVQPILQNPKSSLEEQAAQRAFNEMDGTMMPDGIKDGTGRETLPI